MNDDLKGLVDIGKLSEPVVKIIEAARDAIATLYQPSGIVRGAKAEAKALLVHTQADEEMKDIRMRAQASRDLELLRYQKNRERICSSQSRWLRRKPTKHCPIQIGSPSFSSTPKIVVTK